MADKVDWRETRSMLEIRANTARGLQEHVQAHVYQEAADAIKAAHVEGIVLALNDPKTATDLSIDIELGKVEP